MDLSVQVDDLTGDDAGWAVARLGGEVDVATAPQLREALIGHIAGGRTHLVVDLSDVAFLDSTGLGVIVSLLKRARTAGGDLRLAGHNPSIRRILEVTSLDRVLPLADTVADALEAAGPEPADRPTGTDRAERAGAGATRVELAIPPRRDHLALVRLVVSAVVAIDRPLPERRLEDLRLAVTEACANAVEAQLAHGAAAPLLVVIEVRAAEPGVEPGVEPGSGREHAGRAEVFVSITDHAGGFDPGDLPAMPPVTDPGRLGHEHGLGLALMRSHADEVRFTPTADGTTVELVVRSD